MFAFGPKQTSLVAPRMSRLEVKRTWPFALQMSAFDAVDGARSAASKCYRLVALARAIEGGEARQRRRRLKF